MQSAEKRKEFRVFNFVASMRCAVDGPWWRLGGATFLPWREVYASTTAAERDAWIERMRAAHPRCDFKAIDYRRTPRLSKPYLWRGDR